jgi:glyoxylase-like metal-dependent hydrolase (beta-lactamase superfamily II)
MRYRVISIGALSRHALWNETQAKRLSHATTTLVQDKDVTILIDPSLPAEVLVQRLDERAGITPDEIDVVFLTNFRPAHRRALPRFEHATWLMHAPEIDAMLSHLNEMAGRVEEDDDGREVLALLAEERRLLQRIRPADERLSAQVHLFPCPGVTPGAAGLLLPLATKTVIIAGDAVVTQDHYAAGRVYEQVTDLEAAQESFQEILQIADEIVPGHDNLFAAAGG